MKLMMAVVMMAVLAGGQAKPDPKQAPAEVQVKVLKAQVAVKDASAELANLNAQWQNTLQQQQQIQAAGAKATEKMKNAQTALEQEKEAAIKAVGLDPAKYSMDDSSLAISPKAIPAPATPSPEKK